MPATVCHPRKNHRRGFVPKTLLIFVIVALALCACAHRPPAGNAAPEAAQAIDLRRFVPTTVSEGWHPFYATLPDPTRTPIMPGPDDLIGWKRVHDSLEQRALTQGEAVLQKLGVQVAARDLGGVPVLEITPAGWRENHKRLIYTHGGAYVFFSARSTLPSSAMVANRTGLKVISIDYTNPPQARWRAVCDQVVAVFKALNQEGFAMQDLAIYGDSAGGGLAGGAVLKLRDAGLGVPAAVVLWSPWADITETGDSYQTLKEAEPSYTYARLLGPAANAYADPAEQKHPYVSPVYGDFTRGFPPTLIQGGTREIFLSNFVRLYQAIDTAGPTVKLDLYEGMPHVFQIRMPDSPEAKTALNKVDAFLVRHLLKN